MPNSASSRAQQLIEKRNELAATVRSRKRKLCELYAVTTSPDPQPAPLTPESLPPGSAVASFLAHNDIENGHLFDESSLPPRPKVDWLPPSPPEEVDDIAPADDGDFHSAQSQSPETFPRDRSRLASPQSSSQKTSNGHTPEVGISTHQHETDLPNGSIPTPRSAVESDEVLRPQHDKFPPPSKAATPHSPPDSPRSQYVDADASKQEDFTRDAEVAPRKDHNVIPASEDGPQSRQASAPPPKLAVAVESPDQPQSPLAKGPVAPRGQGRGASLPPRGSPRNKSLGQKTSNRTSPRKTPERRLDVDMKTQRKSSPRLEPLVAPYQDASRTEAPRTPAATSFEPNDTHRLVVDTSRRRHPLSSIENRSSSKRSVEDSTLSDVGSKPKRLKRNKQEIVVKLAKADRYIPAVRNQRLVGGADYRHAGGKKDYMHVLFLKQALDSASVFKTDLSNMLGATSKTLSTLDWEASLREKNECAVVKRIYDMQQRNTWCLRQPKPYPEPARPSTHWDHLLREAKWLQTDFREERKFKMSMCQELAQWCKEWYEAPVARRSAMQVGQGYKVVYLGQHAEKDVNKRSDPLATDASSDLSTSNIQLDKLDDVFDPTTRPDVSLLHDTLDEDLIQRLPLFEPWKSMRPSEGQDMGSISADVQRMAYFRQAIAADAHGSRDETPAPELPPEDSDCAIFDPAWKQLRARVNTSTTLRMPNSAMPPMGFYENRRASQWTPEDDNQLKQYAKDFPSNWSLISDRLSNRSLFVPSINRRTPWECYERLLSQDGIYADPGMRQYARQFSITIDRIRARWQQNVQHNLQAQGVTQLTSPPRFPAPQRVERKMPSRRFACILDGARKLARKRESAENNRKQSQHESQAQGGRALPQQPKSDVKGPQYWSQMKYEREEHTKRKAAQYRHQHAALLQAQQQNARQPNQSLYNGGLAQRTGSRDGAPAAPQANGHLTVPGTNAHRSSGSQSSSHMPVPNGVQSSNNMAAQMAMGAGRPQTGMPMQQRMQPGFNATGQQMSDQNIQQVMAAQQARQQQQQQQQAYQRQMGPGQVNGHGSPTLANMNGLPSANSLNQFSSTNGDSLQSPRLSQSAQSGSTQTSPHLSQQLMAQFGGGRPHQLSSGHVTVLDSLRHKISQENPALSGEEVMNLATSQLQKTMHDQNSVNYAQNRAMNAAAGVHHMSPQQQQAQQQQRPPTQQGMQNSAQSPYPNPQQSPYLQNSMLSMQGRSSSPGNPMQGQQQNYGQSMQAQLSAQMRRNGLVSPTGVSNPASSPPMSASMMPAMGFPNGPARTPTPGQNQMRPPSSAMMDGRPGSANEMGMNAGSPRPMSSQGVQ